jgi:hypothetical protein
VARRWIDRLGLAAEPLPRTGIDEQAVRHARERRRRIGVEGRHVAGLTGEVADGDSGRLHGRRVAGRGRVAGRSPRGQASVKQRDVAVAVMAQQPPRPRRDRPTAVVVDDDRTTVAHPCDPHRVTECVRIGQRVTAVASVPRIVRQCPVEVDEHRSGDVCLRIQIPARSLNEVPADIQQGGSQAEVRVAERLGQPGGIDERMSGHLLTIA